MKKFKEWFSSINSDTKKNFVKFGVVGVFIAVMLLAYNAKKNNQEPVQNNTVVKEKKTDWTKKDEDLALRIGLKNELKIAEEKKLEELKKQQSEIDALRLKVQSMEKGGEVANRTPSSAQNYGDLTLNGVPPVPVEQSSRQYGAPAPSKEKPKEPIIINGAIGNVSVSKRADPKDNSTAKVSSKVLKNFIPSGTLLKGTLLNGMYAPTMGKAKSSPYPALFRLWDLGFLPNEVRKDLSGCFILGQAYGELSDSRVHVRLDKLSCISNDQKKVLEKALKGFVNGDDGKVGIYGEIRANFGKIALAALLAEFVAAAGDTIKSATQVVTQNPFGGVTSYTPKTEDILISAAGSGFGQAAKMIAEFYLDIMKEMSPVIEVSGRRNVEIIISDGIELITDDFEWIGVKDNENTNILDIIN